ncbi:MAG: hypothetical protein AAF292_16860 [Pseudomonadota bacterium]
MAINAGSTQSVDLHVELDSLPISVAATTTIREFDAATFIEANVDGRSIRRRRFAIDDEKVVHVHIEDDGQNVDITFADTDDEDIGQITISHGGAQPKTFKVDINGIGSSQELKDAIIGSNADEFDVVGDREPPSIDPFALFEAARNQPEYAVFMRNERPDIAGNASETTDAFGPYVPLIEKGGDKSWKCAAACLIPACGLLCLFWFKRSKKKSTGLVARDI